MYILLSILLLFHWPLLVEALCSMDNCLASHLMHGCYYVWDGCVYNGVNFFLRCVDASVAGSNKLMFIN